MTKKMLITVAPLVLAACTQPTGQSAASTGVAPAAAAVQSSDANQEEANKKVVHDFYRFVWEPRNLQAFNDYTSPDYIEHNPRFPGRRENIVNFLKSAGGVWSKPGPVLDELHDPPALIIADGELVQWVFKRTRKDPRDSSKTYEAWWYDTFRVRNGRIVEHWDNATLENATPIE